MVRGRFKSFCHDHYFEPSASGTLVIDVLEFESPFGSLGTLANSLFLTNYLKRLLQTRNAVVRGAAETEVELGATR